MFDFHAHCGEESDTALVCSSVFSEYEKVRRYKYHAYGILNPESSDITPLLTALEEDKEALIGEAGVDKRYDNPHEEKVLYQLLEASKELRRPMIIHQVGHFDVLLKALKHFYPLPPFAIHNFTGSLESALLIQKYGGYISLGPRAERSKHFEKLLKEPFLLESDMEISFMQKKTIEEWYGNVASYLAISTEQLEEMIDERRAVFAP